MATPDSPPDKFLAVSHLTDAQQYRQAARILADSQFQQITSPQYFLISQSIELYLKAFNIAAGVKQSELKKVDTRHSLAKLFKMATEHGYLPKSPKTEAVLELLAPHHADHSFRYRKVGFKSYPTLKEGLETLDRMDREIGPHSRPLDQNTLRQAQWTHARSI